MFASFAKPLRPKPETRRSRTIRQRLVNSPEILQYGTLLRGYWINQPLRRSRLNRAWRRDGVHTDDPVKLLARGSEKKSYVGIQVKGERTALTSHYGLEEVLDQETFYLKNER